MNQSRINLMVASKGGHEAERLKSTNYMLYCMVYVSVSERDAFDTLFDHAPDKLNVVKKVGL